MRPTVFVADATPVFAAGTAPTTTSVAGAITQPIARVRQKNQTPRTTGLVSGDHNTVSASIAAVPIRPADTTGDVPRRRTARPTSRRRS